MVSPPLFVIGKKGANLLFRTCTLHGQILTLKQDESTLHYRSMRPIKSLSPNRQAQLAKPIDDQNEHEETERLLRHYLNLGPDLSALYEQWSSVDPNFKKRAPRFTGVRILKQDAWEALIGFICSSNNNIVRISQMVRALSFYPRLLFDYLKCLRRTYLFRLQ